MALNPFFSKRSVMGLDSVIQSKVSRMCDAISAYKDQDRIVHIGHALTAIVVDITTEYCMSLLP